MPPLPLPNAFVIALDVGRTVSKLREGEEKTFFELSRDCVSRIIQRKIISDSKDVLSIILIGSEDSNNTLAASGYKHIECKFDFQLASWDMLSFIEKEVRMTQIDSDWFGALIVSMEMLKRYIQFNDVQSKEIVFFSDFTQSASDDLDVISRVIQALDIQITIIGPDSVSLLPGCDDADEAASKIPQTVDSAGGKLLHQLWGKVSDNLVICNFESALKHLCSYVRRPKRVTCWNCVLDIGEVKINISMFKKTDPKPAKKFDTRCVKPTSEQDSSAGTATVVRNKVSYYKHVTGDGNRIVDVEVKPEDTVEGYRYGATVIPFTKEDKTILDFKSGPKSFSVIGFTSVASVPYYLLSGESSYVVLARDKDQNAEVALSAIIQGMEKMQCLAVVRKVHMNDSRLALGILYPVVQEILSEDADDVSHKEFLLYVELPFEEEVKSISFPSLEQVARELTPEQLAAVDSLIDGMNLMDADKEPGGEPCEAFEVSSLHDLKEQFFHHCVIQRGLDPERPLPASLPSHIEKFAKVPKLIQERSKTPVERVKDQFKIELKRQRHREVGKTEAVQPKRKAAAEHFTESEIGEKKDEAKREWMKLFREFPTESKMDEFFWRLSEEEVPRNSDLAKSFAEVFGEVRRMYLRVNPDSFNWWLRKFKEYASQKDGLEGEVWAVVVAENLGLISVRENQYSDVSEEEAEEFLCSDDSASRPCTAPKRKKQEFLPLPDSLDDLLEEQMTAGPLG